MRWVDDNDDHHHHVVYLIIDISSLELAGYIWLHSVYRSGSCYCFLVLLLLLLLLLFLFLLLLLLLLLLLRLLLRLLSHYHPPINHPMLIAFLHQLFIHHQITEGIS